MDALSVGFGLGFSRDPGSGQAAARLMVVEVACCLTGRSYKASIVIAWLLRHATECYSSISSNSDACMSGRFIFGADIVQDDDFARGEDQLVVKVDW